MTTANSIAQAVQRGQVVTEKQGFIVLFPLHVLFNIVFNTQIYLKWFERLNKPSSLPAFPHFLHPPHFLSTL